MGSKILIDDIFEISNYFRLIEERVQRGLYSDIEQLKFHLKMASQGRFCTGECQKTSQADADYKSFITCISESEDIFIDECDGSNSISNMVDVFDTIDNDFLSLSSNDVYFLTPRSIVDVYQLVKHVRFIDIFESVEPSIFLNQAQIVSFVLNYRFWLRKNGYGNFFPFESGGKVFFARVDIASDQKLSIHLYPFDYQHQWCANARSRFFLLRKNNL